MDPEESALILPVVLYGYETWLSHYCKTIITVGFDVLSAVVTKSSVM
jgi:hypothetical protein